MFCSLRLLLWCEYACLTWYKQTSKSLRVSHSKYILKWAELHSMNSTRREKVRHIGRLLFYSESISPYLSITMETVAINETSHSHLNRPCGLSSFVPLVTSLVLTVIDNFNMWLEQGKLSSESYPKEHDSVKPAREKNAKTHLKLTGKFQGKSCSITHPRSSLIIQSTFRECHQLFPREMTSEKRAQKFHTDDASLPRSG